MALKDLYPRDIWFKIEGKTQLENIILIHDYTVAHDMGVDFQSIFPRGVVEDSYVIFHAGDIYKYEIHTKLSNLDPTKLFFDYGCAEFFSDEEKIILRPFYTAEEYSVAQRDRILTDFVKY